MIDSSKWNLIYGQYLRDNGEAKTITTLSRPFPPIEL